MTTPAEGRQIPINSATKAQLRAFANHLGLPTTNLDSEDKLREKIASSGYEEAHIIVFDPAPVAAAKARAVASGDAVDEPMVNLTVFTQEGAGGKRPVFVGVNGKALLIPRNRPCDVKLRYLRALENAVETKYEFDEEEKANVARDMPSYPFQVHRMPSDKAVADWHAYEAAEEARKAASATPKKAA